MPPPLPRPTYVEHNPSYITTTIHPDAPSSRFPSNYTTSHPSTRGNTTNGAPNIPRPHEAPQTINIGTRKSYLARVQTDLVVASMREIWPQHTYTVHAISTMGDKNQVTALSEFGAKSLWTFELEAMLLEGKIDFIVHCLKG